MRGLSDTSPDAHEVQMRLLREKTPAERARIAINMSTLVTRMAKQAIARANPTLTLREVEHRYIELVHGRDLADAVRKHEQDQNG